MKPLINLKESIARMFSLRVRMQDHIELDPLPDFQTFVNELFDEN